MASAIATTSVAPERRSPVLNAAHLNATTTSTAPGIAASVPNAISASGYGRQMFGWLEDAGLLVLVALAFPLVILIVGTPVAFVVWLLLEIARRSI
jgi:hypothetical protein